MHPQAQAIMSAKSLDDLFSAPKDFAALSRHEQAEADADILWEDLPTFCDIAPPDTVGVWSWDQDRQIVGTCARDFAIEPRRD